METQDSTADSSAISDAVDAAVIKERARLELQAFVAPVCHLGTQLQLIALYGALAKAQGAFEPIEKNRTATIQNRDPITGLPSDPYIMRYADLEEITAKTRPALSENGLATVQVVGPAKHGGGLALFTQLVHEQGGMLVSEISLALDLAKGGSIKDMGAVITYLRRYAKGAMLDVAADDDLDQQERFHEQERAEEPQRQQVQRQPVSHEQRNLEPRAATVTRTDAPVDPDQARDDGYYSQTQFQKSLTGWVAAMRQGKSADYIIKVAQTKRKFTDEMIEIIKQNEPVQG